MTINCVPNLEMATNNVLKSGLWPKLIYARHFKYWLLFLTTQTYRARASYHQTWPIGRKCHNAGNGNVAQLGAYSILVGTDSHAINWQFGAKFKRGQHNSRSQRCFSQHPEQGTIHILRKHKTKFDYLIFFQKQFFFVITKEFLFEHYILTKFSSCSLKFLVRKEEENAAKIVKMFLLIKKKCLHNIWMVP